MTPDTSPVLLAIAAYAESVLAATNPMLSHKCALTCREALSNIATECRRESERTTGEPSRCPPQ